MSSSLADMIIGNSTFKVRNADISYYQDIQLGGRIGSDIRGGTFIVELESSDGSQYDQLTEWMFSKTLMKKGVIRFYKTNGYSRLFDFEFYDAFCIGYQERFNYSDSQPMITILTISPGITRVRNQVKEKPWKISQIGELFENLLVSIGLGAKKEPAPSPSADKKPQIISGFWIDKDKNAIEECYYGKTASIIVMIENSEKGQAEITIKKSDGSELEKGKNQLVINQSVDDDGNVRISSLNIKNSWEETKGKDFDYLVFSVKYKDVQKSFDDEKLKLRPYAQQIMEFRRTSKFSSDFSYENNYGFDWMRDDRESTGEGIYENICDNYTSLKNEYSPFLLKFTKNKDDEKNKLIKKEYFVPWLTLYPGQTIKLSLLINVFEEAKEIKFKNTKDDSVISFEPETPPLLSKGKHEQPDSLTVKCNKPFSADQEIIIYGDDDERRILGKFRILRNNKKFKVKIVIVQVVSKVFTMVKKVVFRMDELENRDKEMSKYLKQAYIKPEFEMAELVLIFDDEFNKKFSEISKLEKEGNPYSTKPLQDIMIDRLYKKYDKEKDYRNHYKIFFFDESLGGLYGQAYGIPATPKSVCVMKSGFQDSTLAHETLHAMGLWHSFSEGTAPDAASNKKYTFSKKKTENIMDYSDIATPPIPVVSLWKWQMEKLWANSEEIV